MLADEVVKSAEILQREGGLDTYLAAHGITRDEVREQVESAMIPFEGNIQRVQAEILFGIGMMIGERL